jgi:formylglycine-generating enzyme required for sulfatase activity
MKPADNIKNLFENSKITVGSDVDKKILNKANSVLPRQAIQPDRQIWSMIMHSKLTKPLAAAIIIIAGFLSLTLLDNTVSPAYAIEKTLHAIQKTNWVHVTVEFNGFGDTNSEESWIGFKDSIEIDKKNNGNIRFANGTNDTLYQYNAEQNTVTISSMSDQYTMPRRTPLPASPVELLEQLISNIEKEGQTKITIGKKLMNGLYIKVIQIDAFYENSGQPNVEQKLTLEVESKTNLLLNVHMIAFSDNTRTRIGSAMAKFDYPTNGPTDIYAVGAPIDATVIDRLPATTDSANIKIKYKTTIDPEDNNREILMLYGDFNIDLVKIPSGEFLMGAGEDEIGYPKLLLNAYSRSEKERVRNIKHPSDEDPQHLVKIENSFYMSKFEITCGQFRMFRNEYRKMPHWVGNIGSKMVECKMDNDDQPAGVSFQDAKNFCEWLSEKTGLNVRVACESEWEYACRAGTKTRFFWGDAEQDAGKYANLSDLSYEKAAPRSNYTLDTDDGYVGPAPVGQYLPNPFGLFDMLGNNPEWADGVYSDNAFSIDPEGKQYENIENKPVVKGGSWQVGSLINGRCASRRVVEENDMPNTMNSYIGFRIVIDKP